MRSFELDMHGVRFVTDDEQRGFITRGALQDLSGDALATWTEQGPAFNRHSAEIEAFAGVLHRHGMLEGDIALIKPAFVLSRAA